MKSTKTMLMDALAAGALLAGSLSLSSQNSTNTPPASTNGTGMKGRSNLIKELNLTEDQKPKFQEILKGAQEKRKALRADASLTPEERKAKVRTIQEDTNTQLKALLTPDQFAKWLELSKRGHRNGPAAGTPPPPN